MNKDMIGKDSDSKVEKNEIDHGRRNFAKMIASAGAMGAMAMAGSMFPHDVFAQEKAGDPQFRNMRRKERSVSDQDAMEILGGALYGVLTFTDVNGFPHGLPISYNFDKEKKVIHIHGAKSGLKAESMVKNPNVCFTVVTEDIPIFIAKPYDYSAYYHSAMAYGKIEKLEGQKKKDCLINLAAKYFPENVADASPYYDKYASLIDVWELPVTRLTGKAHLRGTKIVVPGTKS